MCITLYHKGNEGFEKHTYKNVKLHFSNGAKQNDNGFSQSNNLVARIFTDKDINIAPEDRLEIGISNNTKPSKDSLLVLRITDNRIGMHKHYKVECI